MTNFYDQIDAAETALRNALDCGAGLEISEKQWDQVFDRTLKMAEAVARFGNEIVQMEEQAKAAKKP